MDACMVFVCALAIMQTAHAGAPAGRFALPCAQNILEEEHFGLAHGMLAAGIPYRRVGGIEGIWSPPWVSSDFSVELTIDGQPIRTDRYTWRYGEVECRGRAGEITVVSEAVLIPGSRAGLIVLGLANDSDAPRTVSVAWNVRGTLDETMVWEFARPQSATAVNASAHGSELRLVQGSQAIVLRSDVAWDAFSGRGVVSIALKPRERRRVDLGFTIGKTEDAVAECARIFARPGRTLQNARAALDGHVRDLFDKLPVFDSDNAALTAFYNRSMVHLLMNRWTLPNFVLNPYFGTGSVKGGCVCNYLWNFGEVWEILPLYDPVATREHIKQFLRTDLVSHFAFVPTTGEAFGPWYMVNQEKIIGLIYYYVKNTGDLPFLGDCVDGKTILEWAEFHARVLDDPSKPVALIDYGPSNSHLELRRGYPYNHVMPDLNGRRYGNYRMAAELCNWAGKPAPDLLERAAALKTILKQRLWDADARWFRFVDGQGREDRRYTIQMFKLFGSGVLDAEQEAGLLSHLNEREFLSEYGLHSMAKTDIAYDPVDIDNGGGGACVCFPPQIAERFYKTGHTDAADDILRRILWWGGRMPYWGDSLVAHAIDYRKDTPLQCTLDGAAAAQCVIFGLFGVDARPNGDIVFNPHRPAFADRISLRGLRLHGRSFDVEAAGDSFRVCTRNKRFRSSIGRPVQWHAGERAFRFVQ